MTATQEPPQPPRPAAGSIVIDRHVAWGLLSALAIVIGSIGPWFSADEASLNGASGLSDGWLTLALGIWAFAWIAFRRTPTPKLLAAIIVGGLAAGVVARFLGIEDRPQISLGWGLVLVIVGAVSLAAWSIVTLTTMPTPKRNREWSRAAWVVILVVLFVPFGLSGPGGEDAKSLARHWIEKRSKSSDDEAPATTTAATPSKVEDDCDTLRMWSDEGPEGSCIGPDGKTMFHVVDGDSTLVLYEISVRDVAVEMTPVIAGDPGPPARASGTWARVTMTIRNEGQATFRPNPLMFDLGVREASFTPDLDAMELSRTSCLGKAKPLPPGKKTTCWVAFDVDPERADHVTHSGALSVYQPSDFGETEASQPVGLIRLRDAKGGTGSDAE